MPIWVRLGLVLLASAAILVVVTAYLMAYMLLRPPRMSDGKAAWVLKRISPGDLGLAYSPVEFRIRDTATGRMMMLAGWWMPHSQAQGRCVVLLHGYADAKVGAVAWGPIFHDLGYNILAVDLRAHGQSGGKFTTAGYFERDDLDQILDQIRADNPGGTRQMVIFGVSLGAAVALATAARRKDISGIILESPIADFREAAVAYFALIGMPGAMFQKLSLRIAEYIAGADFSSVRPLDLLRRVECPVMVVQGELDPLISNHARQEMKEIFCERAMDYQDENWQVPNVGHLASMNESPDLYRERVAGFLSRVNS